MSKFTKVYRKWHAKNNGKYDSAREYHKALMVKFGDWQPPKPLVVVPRLVADFIESENHNEYNREGTLVFEHYNSYKGNGNCSELHKWIADNFDTFLEAIVNGYTVEKEQLYEIRIPLPNGNYASIDSKGYIWGEVIPNKYKLTESEVKNIDERYWAFAVPVYEVEP